MADIFDLLNYSSHISVNLNYSAIRVDSANGFTDSWWFVGWKVLLRAILNIHPP